MINLPKEYAAKMDPVLWNDYQKSKQEIEILKIKLNNAYQSINEINLDTKSNDAEYGRIKLQLISFINEADRYEEEEIDTKLKFYSEEQLRLRAANDLNLKKHKQLMEVVKLDEIKLENLREEIKITTDKIKL